MMWPRTLGAVAFVALVTVGAAIVDGCANSQGPPSAPPNTPVAASIDELLTGADLTCLTLDMFPEPGWLRFVCKTEEVLSPGVHKILTWRIRRADAGSPEDGGSSLLMGDGGLD